MSAAKRGKKLSELVTLLGTLATAYTVDIAHDGTWFVKTSAGAVIYRGTQREVWGWLNSQPTG